MDAPGSGWKTSRMAVPPPPGKGGHEGSVAARFVVHGVLLDTASARHTDPVWILARLRLVGAEGVAVRVDEGEAHGVGVWSGAALRVWP